MPFTPPNAILNPQVGQLVAPASPVVEPRATQALTDAFRSGFITADDVVQRVGQVGAMKQQADVMALREAMSPEAVEARQLAQKAASARAKSDIMKADWQAEIAPLAQQAERAKTALDLLNAGSYGTFEPMKNGFLAAGVPLPMKNGAPDTEAMQTQLPELESYLRYQAHLGAVAKGIHPQKFEATMANGQKVETTAPFSDVLNAPLSKDQMRVLADSQGMTFDQWKAQGKPTSLFGALQPGGAGSLVEPNQAGTTEAEARQVAASLFAQPAAGATNEELAAESPADRQARIDLFNRGQASALSLPLVEVKQRLAAPVPAVEPRQPATPPAAVKHTVEIGGAVPGMPGTVTATAEPKTPEPVKMTGEQQKTLAQATTTDAFIDRMEGDYSKMVKNTWMTGPLAGRAGAAIGAKNWSVPIADFQRAQTSVMANMAKGIYHETGVLSDKDIERYKAALPSINDTPDVGAAKLRGAKLDVYGSIMQNIDTMRAQGQQITPELEAIYQHVQQKQAALQSTPGVSATGAATITLPSGKRVMRDASGNWVQAP